MCCVYFPPHQTCWELCPFFSCVSLCSLIYFCHGLHIWCQLGQPVLSLSLFLSVLVGVSEVCGGGSRCSWEGNHLEVDSPAAGSGRPVQLYFSQDLIVRLCSALVSPPLVNSVLSSPPVSVSTLWIFTLRTPSSPPSTLDLLDPSQPALPLRLRLHRTRTSSARLLPIG